MLLRCDQAGPETCPLFSAFSMQLLSPVLYLILLLVALEMVSIHAAPGKTPGEYQQYLK